MAESMFYGTSPIIFANARKLRNELTDSEVIFWSLLKQHFSNYKFRKHTQFLNILLIFIAIN